MDPVEIRLIRCRSSLKREAWWKVFKKIRPPPILWEPFKVLERLIVFKFTIIQQFRWLLWIFIAHFDLEIDVLLLTNNAQFTNVRRIQSGFYKWKTMDDTSKMFILQLDIDTKIFHSVFVNPCTMQNQRRSRSGVRLTAHFAIESLMANYCMRWGGLFKGLSINWGHFI